nr:TetR/AcrR family transcriptional regulator [Acetatifactor sp.]
MGKMTGMENIDDIPQKVLLLYNAVGQMIAENVDVNGLRVVNITDRAGIGKGTAYEYFDSKEDILSCAMVYGVRKIAQILRKMLEPG